MKKIRYLVMDVDGTLTDGKIYMGNSGELFKVFNVKDGYGIRNIAIPLGIIPIIITGRTSEILKKRCIELGITQLYQGISNKMEKLNEILSGEDYGTVAYIGDDINDISCMKLVKAAGGITGCPQDAIKSIKMTADFVSLKNGGEGAVREFIDWLVLDM